MKTYLEFILENSATREYPLLIWNYFKTYRTDSTNPLLRIFTKGSVNRDTNRIIEKIRTMLPNNNKLKENITKRLLQIDPEYKVTNDTELCAGIRLHSTEIFNDAFVISQLKIIYKDVLKSAISEISAMRHIKKISQNRKCRFATSEEDKRGVDIFVGIKYKIQVKFSEKEIVPINNKIVVSHKFHIANIPPFTTLCIVMPKKIMYIPVKEIISSKIYNNKREFEIRKYSIYPHVTDFNEIPYELKDLDRIINLMA